MACTNIPSAAVFQCRTNVPERTVYRLPSLVALFASVLTLVVVLASFVDAQVKVPAIFIFGDSLVDTGNNDKLLTLARANHSPYGRDFTGRRPTGRFCNGALSVDYLASLCGLPSPPPYLLAGENILGGVNFGSAGSGILNSTGSLFGQHIPLQQQVKYFSDVKQNLVNRIGVDEASILISKSMFYVVIGSNDYILNYFLPVPSGKSPLREQYSPDAFRDLLLEEYKRCILDLYSLGARKIVLCSLPSLGCVPAELFAFRSKRGECISFINDQSKNYNSALLVLIKQLEVAYPDAHFVYLNAYDLLEDIANNPGSYGFRYGRTACCGLGPYNAAFACEPLISRVCSNAADYVFWDLYHPTSAVNAIAVSKFWQGQPPHVYPINIMELAAL
eukprot:c9828_g1_i1 orf=62-1231(-)